MSFPFLQEIALQLDQSPEDDNLGRCWESIREKPIRANSKSSIMKFLGGKQKITSKSLQIIREWFKFLSIIPHFKDILTSAGVKD